jgi:hypothetical protein
LAITKMTLPQEHAAAGDMDSFAVPFHTGSLAGSAQFSYHSPERALDNVCGSATPQDDVWGIGAMALSLAFGVRQTELLSTVMTPGAAGPDRAKLQEVAMQLTGAPLDALFEEFVCCCLRGNPTERLSAAQLLASPFLASAALDTAYGAGAAGHSSGSCVGAVVAEATAEQQQQQQQQQAVKSGLPLGVSLALSAVQILTTACQDMGNDANVNFTSSMQAQMSAMQLEVLQSDLLQLVGATLGLTETWLQTQGDAMQESMQRAMALLT